MDRAPAFSFGDDYTAEEFVLVVTRLVPNMPPKMRKQPAIITWQQLANVNKLRVEHEVNRARGWAYDSGEHGFSHSRGE